MNKLVKKINRFIYKSVIFDLDDTLVETRLIKWEHHKAVAKKFYNIDLKEEKLREHWGKPFTTMIGHLYENSDTQENMLSALLSIRHEFPKTVYAESVRVITELLDREIKVGIVSATNKEFIIEDMTRLGFPVERLTVIQGADDTLVHKPDPQVFLPTFEKLENFGIKKSEMVYVGDSMDDFKAARGAGIDFIAITNGLYSADDFKKEGVGEIITNIEEVLDKVL